MALVVERLDVCLGAYVRAGVSVPRLAAMLAAAWTRLVGVVETTLAL